MTISARRQVSTVRSCWHDRCDPLVCHPIDARLERGVGAPRHSGSRYAAVNVKVVPTLLEVWASWSAAATECCALQPVQWPGTTRSGVDVRVRRRKVPTLALLGWLQRLTSPSPRPVAEERVTFGLMQALLIGILDLKGEASQLGDRGFTSTPGECAPCSPVLLWSLRKFGQLRGYRPRNLKSFQVAC